MALDDDQNENEDVFSNEPGPEPVSGGNSDEQSNRSFRMMVLGLGAIGALGVLLIALIFLSRQGERNQIAVQNQAIQATNTAIAILSQITPTPLPTNTPAPTNTAVPSPAPAKKDIVDTVLAAGNFKTLANALQTAGLSDLLKGQGPFTIFAPTDDAFAQLPAGQLDALLKDPKKLGDLLKYHIVQGAMKAADIAKLTSAKTLEGETVVIGVQDNSPTIDDAKVTTPDIETANGVIHVIDRVLQPPEMLAAATLQATSATAVALAQGTAPAGTATPKPSAGTAVPTLVPTRVPPPSTGTVVASAGITSTRPLTSTTGTAAGQMPPTGASDITWVLLAAGLVAVLIVARRMRTSQS